MQTLVLGSLGTSSLSRMKSKYDSIDSPQKIFKTTKLFPFQVALGETALAFYTATNPTDRTVDGISTYNVVPFEAGQYFNKIQCFCFEEQRLNPHEQVSRELFLDGGTFNMGPCSSIGKL